MKSIRNVTNKADKVNVALNVKNSQFAQPLFEFSGACSGCGETPYIKLITQLFGDREIVANATGCSSIYSGSVPSTPTRSMRRVTVLHGQTPLFEDFCEYGLGMYIGLREAARPCRRSRRRPFHFRTGSGCDARKPLSAGSTDAMTVRLPRDRARLLWRPAVRVPEKGCPDCRTIVELSHHLTRRSQWIIGGDGASYDIGFGGLDHVIASGKNVNILVLDTEVYPTPAARVPSRPRSEPSQSSPPPASEYARRISDSSPPPTVMCMWPRSRWVLIRRRPAAIREAEAYDARRL